MTLAVDGRSIVKTFGPNARPVLKSVDFQVAQGEFIMLAGPSGSGKTTLLSILGCVLRPTSGTLKLYGSEVSSVPESGLPRLRRSLIGFIFQGHNLIASMTARENVAVQLQMRGYPTLRAFAEAERLLDRVGLGAKLEAKTRELSGGERQRVAIVRSIAGAPPLILADEPTASLDLENGMLVTRMLKELAEEQGHTVIIVTHDSRIFDYADRIEHLEDGKFVSNNEASIPGFRISAFLNQP